MTKREIKTYNHERNGAEACKKLSQAAINFIATTDPLTVWEYEENGRTLYAYEMGDNALIQGLTLEELNTEFEEWAAEFAKVE